MLYLPGRLLLTSSTKQRGQAHRDTTLADLLGDQSVLRVVDEQTGGELVQQRLIRGGVLTADLVSLQRVLAVCL